MKKREENSKENSEMNMKTFLGTARIKFHTCGTGSLTLIQHN